MQVEVYSVMLTVAAPPADSTWFVSLLSSCSSERARGDERAGRSSDRGESGAEWGSGRSVMGHTCQMGKVTCLFGAL